MKRRAFITLLGGALASPFTARGEESRGVRRIGALMAYAEGDPDVRGWLQAFRQKLQELGWVEGRNLRIEYRWASTDVERMRMLARQLVASAPDLLLASSTPATRALTEQTRSIPIIFANIVDPVGSGFIASMSKPGGNVTGFINLEGSITGKYLELLKEIAPRIKRVLIFYNPTTATYAGIYLKPFRDAAATLSVEPSVAPVRSLGELDAVIAAHAREPDSALIAMPDGFNTANSAAIAELATRHRLPSIYSIRTFPTHGGLMSYGNDVRDNYRRAAGYVDRILRGENPGDLPAQLPVKFELVINLKTAKALGLDVPLFLQQRADDVIE